VVDAFYLAHAAQSTGPGSEIVWPVRGSMTPWALISRVEIHDAGWRKTGRFRLG